MVTIPKIIATSNLSRAVHAVSFIDDVLTVVILKSTPHQDGFYKGLEFIGYKGPCRGKLNGY